MREDEFKAKSTYITDVFSKINIDKSDITPEEFRKANKFISKYRDVFSTGDADVGHATDVTHKIELSDEHPFAQRYRKIPPAIARNNEVREHISLSIRKSKSPWASNVVLEKKDNTLILCVDFRQQNKKTMKEAYALPRIEEM